MKTFFRDLFHAALIAATIGFPFILYFWRM
jgi:hypothetical protein